MSEDRIMRDSFGEALIRILDAPEAERGRKLQAVLVGIATTVVMEYDRLFWAIFDREGRN